MLANSRKKCTFANKDKRYNRTQIDEIRNYTCYRRQSIDTHSLEICLGGTFEQILTLPRPDTAPTLLQQEPVDIILLDMNFSLGVNSGQEGLLWLRTFRRLHANIPVVLITAYADIQLAIKGLKTGAADFVTKPWDNDELIRTLKDAIDRSQEVETLESIETTHIHKVVDQCHGNISRAAELLGITRQTLYAKLKR